MFFGHDWTQTRAMLAAFLHYDHASVEDVQVSFEQDEAIASFDNAKVTMEQLLITSVAAV